MKQTSSLRRALLLGLVAILTLATAKAFDDPKPFEPKVSPASDEAVKALRGFRLPKGVAGKVWAAEPLLANPVSFCFDEKGRCFVAETFRLHHGVTDNRNHMNWLDDDLASRTVADRVAMYKKWLKNEFATYETEHDRVRLVEDTKGAGVADKSTVFADGFRDAAAGIGSGVLARNNKVWYTCIPDLWLLEDTKGTGKADIKKVLATGFGVHVAFLGHDLHGLRMGPDGRIYFSSGDRGLNVKTKEGKDLFFPDMGAVLRCEPDGSNLEVVARGLRNPQELAFDQFGNLFTVDNNSDSGDKARVVYIVEGGDSGWRTGYQYGSSLSDRGPFNAEKIWHLPPTEQPAYIVPPLAHITSGPSGLCFNYGATALPERYRDHFFICDFHGSAGGSGVYSFAMKPKGAAFEVTDGHEAIWSILATDCDFGPDGGFYISDWVDGWNLTGKGRIYRFADPEMEKKTIVTETKKLLAEGFEKRSIPELAKLLEFGDLRVRQEAQFALVSKNAVDVLSDVALKGSDRLARLHAIWGLGMMIRGNSIVAASKLSRVLLKDPDAEVRAQTLKVWGESGMGNTSLFIPALRDPEPRVRLFALLGLSHLQTGLDPESVKAIADAIRDNADQDTYLRHAAVMALATINPADKAVIHELMTSDSPSVRLAITLALRRQQSPTLAEMLNDLDPRVATEAARAIHDENILAALPALAAHLLKPGQPEFLQWRALNAHYRLGGKADADAVATFAARANEPEKLRIEAVKLLGDWAKPGRRDRITGLTTNLGERDATLAVDALRPNLGGIFTGPDKLRQEAAKVAAKLGVKEVGPLLFEIASDPKKPSSVRVETLRALEALKDKRLDQARDLALNDEDLRVRTEGRRLLAKAQPNEALPVLAKVLDDGKVVEVQGALGILGDMKEPGAGQILAKALTRLKDKKLPPEAALDLLEALGKRSEGDLKQSLAAFEQARSKTDHLAKWREAMVGGDAENGKRIFEGKTSVYCVRCHKLDGKGGDVGPELTGIAKKQSREYLLESIVDPNKQIAKGFETVVLTLTNGKTVVGIVKAEDAKELRIITAEGNLLTIPKDKIDERQAGKSAMPEDLVKNLSRSEVRDLVEFLSSLK